MKETIAVLFGGQSSEHVVSCMSAVNVIDQIDKEKYNVLLIGITEDGRWILTKSAEEIRSGVWRKGTLTAVLSPDASKKCVVISKRSDTAEDLLRDDDIAEALAGAGVRQSAGLFGCEVPVDVVFPARAVRRGRNRPGTSGTGPHSLCGLRCAGKRCLHG